MRDEDDLNLGFKPQKYVIYNKLLPYGGGDQIGRELVDQLKDIKENLSKAVLLRDIRPGCIHWVARLSRFVKLYGVCMSKEDHILFVKLMYELSVTLDQEFWVTAKFAQMLTILLKKKELLAPGELVLDWRPLFHLYESLFYNSYNTIGMLMLPSRTRRTVTRLVSRKKDSSNAEGIIESMIRACRSYFPHNSTAEILETVRPLMCPFDMSMQRAMVYLELFLPTSLGPDFAHCSWKLWFEELLGIWNACHNSHLWYWENNVFWLFARLAWHNIGFVDWEEHLPTVFTKVLRSFRLPVSYKKAQVSKGDGLSQFASSMFIVANLGGTSKTQDHLERLFKSLESYYHPSNSGHWSRLLHEFLNKLTLLFIRRLHRERYKKPSWETEVAEHKKLTEEEITAFVRCVQTPAMLAMFSHTGTHDAGVVFHRLSLLRPEIVTPPLLEQLYASLETTTEPHRLTASLECVVCVARTMVQGVEHYPEGQTHVIPLLLQTLPGIDPNDIRKCMVTFQFIYTLVTLVPFVDCSSALDQVSDLTEVEQQVCLQTASFEDFVLQFMDRCFALIENSTLEQITQLDRETEKMNKEENMLEMGLSSTFSVILTQSHPNIYRAALQRLQSFISGKMIEIHVAGKFAANMCRSAVKVNPKEALKVFVPGVCRLLLALTDNEEVQNEENLDDEVLFNLLLLSELVRCGGHLVEYVPQITQVLKHTLHLKCREGYHLAGSVLRFLLKYLGLSLPSEYRSVPYNWDTPLTEYMPIRHWGEAGNIHNLEIKWIEPSAAEEEAMTSLVRTFLMPELKLLKEVAQGKKEVSREILQQSLSITLDVVLGAGVALPHWNEDPIQLMSMAVKKDNSKFMTRQYEICVTLDSPDFPSNVRKATADVILELVNQMLAKGSDDTKALSRAISIFSGLIFFHGVSKEDFDARWKGFQFIKDALANKLARNKQHIRSLLIERAVLHQESRILENSTLHLTETHSRIMTSLLQLSTSQYSEVRSKAQSILSQVFQYFPYSYKIILPDLISYLSVDPTENHEQFKGSLYVLLGKQNKSLMVRRDWDSLNQLWPALIAAKHSEKPSIIKLMNAISDSIYYFMELFAIHHKISDGAVGAASALLASDCPKPAESAVSKATAHAACAQLSKLGQSNFSLYNDLIEKLVTLLESGNLHWRCHNLTLNLLGCLIRPDVTYPAPGVRALSSNLIHDNIRIRETCIFYMPWILKNQKRKHLKVRLDPYNVDETKSIPEKLTPGDSRPDNEWMQYNSIKKITTEEQWETLRYVEKTYFGWYTWPREMMVYAPPSKQPPLDRKREDLKEEEQVLYDFFMSESNIEKLVSFLSLEENKERDGFNTRRYWMFKGLFRNYGDTFLRQFESHIKRLVEETHKSSQRCATEIITGMIRGSKHWTFAKHQALWEMLKPIIQTGIAKVTVETVEDWGTCMATASADRDPNKLSPLLELLLEDPLRAGESAFNVSSRMYMLMGGLGQQEWRVSELSHKLLEYLRPSLSHPYKSIRDRMGSVLTGIFMYDLVIPGGVPSRYPMCAEFIEFIVPQLAILIQESSSSATQDSIDMESSNGSSLQHDFASLPPADSSMFGEGACVPPILGLSNAALSDSDALTKVLSAVQKGGSAKFAGMSQLVNLGGLDPSNLVSARDGKDAFRGAAKIKLRDSCDISSDVICEAMDVMPSDSMMVKNTVHDNHVKSPVNGFVVSTGTEERKVAIRLMNTVCRWLVGHMRRSYNGITPDMYRFLPHLCQLESVDNDPELRNNCVATLALMSQGLVIPERIPALMEAILQVAHSSWWRARAAVLSLLQVAVFTNMFTILNSECAPTQIREMVVGLLADSRLEVQQMASTVLSGLIHCKFILAEEKLLDEFTSKLQNGRKRKRKRKEPLTPQQVLELHAGVLGLCAYVSAFPYDVPDMLPQVLVTLSEHLNDPHPIPATIKKTLSNFRRTHHDNWRDHKQKFTEDQLVVLTDLLLSPSYYA